MEGTYCINCNSSPCKCCGYTIDLSQASLKMVPANLIPDLEVIKNEDGWFECTRNGDVGACVVGYGKTVLEAVGNWSIYSQTVHITCNPPELLQQFSATEVVGYRKCPSRDD